MLRAVQIMEAWIVKFQRDVNDPNRTVGNFVLRICGSVQLRLKNKL